MSAASYTEAATYSVDELAAVAHLLGASTFPGRAPQATSDGRQAALESARRSLLARAVLEIDDDGVLQITAAHSFLLTTALGSAAVVSADHRRRERAETRAWYLSPRASVEHSTEVGDVQRLTRLETKDLLRRIVAFVELAPRPAGDARASVSSRSALDQALAAAARDEAVQGVPEELARALEHLESASHVRSLYRAGERIVGGELSWIDTGPSGLWLIEPSAQDPDRLEVRSSEATHILNRLLSYLPGGEPAG